MKILFRRGAMRWIAGSALAVTALVAGGLGYEAWAQARTRITIYTALENEQLTPFKQAIEAAVPGVEVAWVRDSTGVITARFLAERAAPRADMVLGLAASSMAMFAQANLLQPYTPQGADTLRPQFRSGANPDTWVGMDAFLAAICFNTAEGQRRNAARPATWADLTNPAYRDQIVMPNPASSGTGYLTVAAWLSIMGEEAGWRYMDALHQNIAVYTHSGSAPCVQAARGERMIGISFDMRAAQEKTQGAPIEVILPSEGVGWEMEASGIVRGTQHLQLAQRVQDWVASQGANQLFGRYYAILANPAVTANPPNYPQGAVERMARIDLNWMASNRERILAEWTRRYDSKSAPR
jgi:iron(III) transport system substrate-binding protein